MRFFFQDLSGKVVWRVAEYVRRSEFEAKEADKDVLFMFHDHVSNLGRTVFHCTRGSGDTLVSGAVSFTKTDACKAVIKALKTQQFEQLVEEKEHRGTGTIKTIALIDRVAMSVYALKVQYSCSACKVASQGWISIPFYGEMAAGVTEVENGTPVSTDLFPLPPGPPGVPNITSLFDDHDRGMDDFSEADIPKAPPAAAAASLSPQHEIVAHLAAIREDSSKTATALAQIAESLAKIAVVMEKRK